jgi:hypothetical protein
MLQGPWTANPDDCLIHALSGFGRMLHNIMIRRLAKGILRPVLTSFRPGNVIMFHIGRCGSTVVGDMLNQHQHIYWASELYQPIFSEWQRNNAGKEIAGEMPEDAIELLQRDMRMALHHYYGFEIKPYHFRLIGYTPETFLHHADSLGFTHFIILDRRNRLRKIISSIIAHQKIGKYHIDDMTKSRLMRISVNPEIVEIDFDAKPLLAYLSDYDKQIEELESLLEGRRVLRLSYEEDIQVDPNIAYSRICEFLGLQRGDVSVNLARTNPFPVRDMIGNIDEVEKTLCGTPYEWMLDD